MKKIIYIFLMAILFFTLISCKEHNQDILPSDNSASTDTTSDDKTEISLVPTPSIIVSSPDDTTIPNEPTSSCPNPTPTLEPTPTDLPQVEIASLSEIKQMENELAINEEKIIHFQAFYVKAITDNMDKLMLFVDDTGYITVRVIGGFDTFLKNRYLNCKYDVLATIKRNDSTFLITYNSLSNLTSTPVKVDYDNITKRLEAIGLLYDTMDDIKLTDKGNGVGQIVTFKGTVIATDRTDANSKAVFYDNQNVITVIGDKKVCDGKTDLFKSFEVTGIISILKGAPAVLLLDITTSSEEITIDYHNAITVSPSYFSKWYHVSNKINDPSFADYSKLYLVSGYVNIDTGRSNLNFGLTDNAADTLNDNGIKTSVKGIYLMNYQNQTVLTKENEAIYDAYNKKVRVSCYVSLHQFDSNNHAWKVFMIDDAFTK